MQSLQQISSELSWVDNNRLVFNHNSTKNKVILLVEGDSDRRFFYKIFNRYIDKVIIDSPDSGKPEVINAVSEMRGLNHNNIYGICDTDFDYITGEINNYEHEFFLFTDFHDLEITLLTLGIFDDIYSEYTILGDLKSEHANILKENIFNIAYDIGILKLASMKNLFNLKFKVINHKDHISVDGVNLILNLDSLVDDLISKSSNFDSDSYSKEDVINSYWELKNMNYDKLHICNGHDFCEILALCYKQDFSRDKNLNRVKLESDIRLTCTYDRFESSRLFSLLKKVLIKHGVLDN
ncbi:DUF4435 domain-containing protein [Morganella morganii]|uniref:DUF4435 domain-containing protein n=1 Tax=Morganella morganii TaxID=582 RepID=UPI0021D062E1|nr:DUF4435 domain-containing protein [Morganella morganii]MCU6237897.1 DUF4435 domain-containing protein [Morganella morganii]